MDDSKRIGRATYDDGDGAHDHGAAQVPPVPLLRVSVPADATSRSSCVGARGRTADGLVTSPTTRRHRRSWLLAYQPEDDVSGMQPEERRRDGGSVPRGAVDGVRIPLSIDQCDGGIGLSLQLASGELLELLAHPASSGEDRASVFVPFLGRRSRCVSSMEDGVLSLLLLGGLDRLDRSRELLRRLRP